MKLVLLLLLLQSLHVIYGQSGGCDKLKTNKCSSCLELPGCIWCSDVNYTSTRCNTQEEHARFQCNMTVDGNPSVPKLEPVTLNNRNQITPRRVSSRVRTGEPIDFTVDIQPSPDYPVDFYILMDLTDTMADDLNNVKKLAQNISDKLNQLTSESRLAFGSFVDKVVDPYSRREAIGKPFRAGKDIPYDYKHSLTFTDNAQEFKDKINAQVSSGNRDVPEGTFDALMQVAACEKELGWRPKNSTRRMVLIATDDTFHIAGEGRFGGIANPNDAKCHLGKLKDGVRLYDKSLELDYPTINQVYHRLVESRIQPIFAIARKASAYQSIVNKWEGSLSATLGKLGGDSSNIIDLIQESYDKITSKVQLEAANNDENIDVRIENVQCPSSSSDNVCTGVNPGTKVSFKVTVTAKSCQHGNQSSFQLSSAAFGTVQVDLDIICSCDCENTAIPKSPRCSGNGSLVCGNCECDEGWSGEFCQCDSERFSDVNVEKCKSTNETGALICSGNGECDCGVCLCNLVPGTTEKYYGQFCQCSNFNCEQADNELCGGYGKVCQTSTVTTNEATRGECNCGRCECKNDYIGSNCGNLDCTKFLPDCLTDGEGGGKVNCSGHGSCDCGECKCDSFYEGSHCERCPSCIGRCGDYLTCVLCEVFGVTPANKTLCENCPNINKLKSLAELQALQLPTTCQETDDEGCTFYYSYEEKNNITNVYAVESKDCPEGPDVLLIVLAVIGGIVGIGIILLILWKLLTAMVDRREYQKFEQDRAKSKWHREKNPLYQPATSTVQNPTFVGSKT